MSRPADRQPVYDEQALDALRFVVESTGRHLADAEVMSIDPSRSGDLLGVEVTTTSPGTADVIQRIYVEPARLGSPAPGVVRAQADESAWDVWAYPADPDLPALAAAAHPTAVRVLLARLNLAVPEELHVESMSYRAHRRAVLRVRTSDWTIYLKVVPPPAAESIAARHERWSTRGISVPPVIAWSPDGLVALGALPGRDLSNEVPLLAADPSFPSRLAELRDRIARVDEPAPARRSFAARAGWYRQRLSRRFPQHEATLAEIARSIVELHGTVPTATASIHGDLHLGQLFADDQGRLSVLDLDTAGLGDPADDDAAMWAHLVATVFRAEAQGETETSAAAAQLADALAPSRQADRDRVRRAAAISAAHLLGHTLTGSIPVDAGIDLALTTLRRTDESPLISSYFSSHPAPTH